MASAWARTYASVIFVRAQYHVLQPIGGVSARVSPTTILKSRSAVPSEFRTASLTRYTPGVPRRPVIRPVAESRDSPAGRPSAEKRSGGRPVAGTVQRKGRPGRTPKTFGPLT